MSKPVWSVEGLYVFTMIAKSGRVYSEGPAVPLAHVITELEEKGLIEKTPMGPVPAAPKPWDDHVPKPRTHRLTPKGVKFRDMLRATPEPVRGEWVDPREVET